MARRKALLVGVTILVANVVLAVAAVVANWPSQFGKVGTDAGDDVLLVGTAISAPLLPMVILAASLVGLRRGGRAAHAGLVGYLTVAVVVAIGGLGELLAAPTTDAPRAVLTFGGVWWLATAMVMVTTAVPMMRRPRVHTS